MLEISKLSGEIISKLAGAYMHATFYFGMDPMKASSRKQRKIRKWISKEYIEEIPELPEEVMTFFKESSDAEVLQRLKECGDLVQFTDQQMEDKTESTLAMLDETVKSAIKEIIDIAVWPETKCIGNDARLIVEDTLAYKRILILENANGVPEGLDAEDCYDLYLNWQKAYNRFCLFGQLEDSSEDTLVPFALTFESARVEIEVYNACIHSTIAANPWDWLQSICVPIAMKADLTGDYCNKKEKDLLPLIREIACLGYYRLHSEQEFCSFRELKALTTRYGYEKAEKLLTKLETIKCANYKYGEIAQRLIACLCKRQCQPLWREIYQKLCDSQEGYPDKADAYINQESLVRIRNAIQNKMKSKGYTGTYPNFVKTGVMKGVHLEHSYNMTYWVGMGERVQYHIHCIETFDELGCMEIQFLCGAAFLKKSEETDIFDCLFDAKGKRLFYLMHHYVPLPDNTDAKSDDLDKTIAIAVKKAECIKLSKAEQKGYYGKMIPGWGMFWGIFLIMGGFFGIAMTLAMMVLWIVASLVDGTGSSLSEILKDFPWLLLLAIGWIGFGGTMGIVEVLAHRK